MKVLKADEKKADMNKVTASPTKPFLPFRLFKVFNDCSKNDFSLKNVFDFHFVVPVAYMLFT